MKTSVIRIKNMVCARCIASVRNIAENLDLCPGAVGLGYAEIAGNVTAGQLAEFARQLEKVGFELLKQRRDQIIEEIKITIIHHFYEGDKKPAALNFSDWLSSKVNMSYSHLSSVFSEREGTTIEQYIIAQRIERAKELLSYGTMSMSEISDELEYRSPQHFSGQFKNVTGMSPSQYRKSGGSERKGIDEVN